MPNNEILTAEQSVAKMIDIQHRIAESYISPNIKIAWNNIIIDKKRIYIEEYLFKGHERKDIPYTESLIMADMLKIGDLVEVTPLKREQLFIVKCKLVYLGKTEDEESG